jgi:cysteine desulfurase
VARETLLAALDDGWADPRRLHAEGRRARALLDGARAAVAGVLAVRPDEVSFTPSATIGRQVGLRGLLHGRRRAGQRLVVSAVEHSALLQTGQWHAALGGEVTTVGVDRLGRVDASAFAAAVGSGGVAAACLQAANGEVGTRQPLDVLAAACSAAGVPLLVDAGPVVGRDDPPVVGDVLVADARSWAGPPGVGVLVVRTGVRWRSDGPADENEHGRVAGEVDVPTVLAAAAALLDAEEHRASRAALALELTTRLRSAAAAVPDTEVVGDPVDRLPHVVTFSSLFVDGEALVHELDRRGFAVASGSACTASTLEPSHVLAAMGVLTHGNIRVTLPLEPVADDVTAFCAILPEVVAVVRSALGVQRL